MITILDVAKARGAKETKHGINGGEFHRLGLPITGGCEVCAATITAYNAYPSKSGYLRCSSDLYDEGFETVEEFEQWLKEEDE